MTSLGYCAPRLSTPVLRALVELFAAVRAPEPTIALRRQVSPLGHRCRATAHAIHCDQPPSCGNPTKTDPVLLLASEQARGMTEPLNATLWDRYFVMASILRKPSRLGQILSLKLSTLRGALPGECCLYHILTRQSGKYDFSSRTQNVTRRRCT